MDWLDRLVGWFYWLTGWLDPVTDLIDSLTVSQTVALFVLLELVLVIWIGKKGWRGGRLVYYLAALGAVLALWFSVRIRRMLWP